MHEYHKIDTVFKRDPATKHKTLLMGDWSQDAFGYLANNEWVFTEKVDGTNIRIMIDGGDITFGGKTDDAQIPAALVQRLQERFLPHPNKDALLAAFPDGGCLYGEGYGARIQKGGGNYRQDQDFVLFDVKVGEGDYPPVDGLPTCLRRLVYIFLPINIVIASFGVPVGFAKASASISSDLKMSMMASTADHHSSRRVASIRTCIPSYSFKSATPRSDGNVFDGSLMIHPAASITLPTTRYSTINPRPITRLASRPTALSPKLWGKTNIAITSTKIPRSIHNVAAPDALSKFSIALWGSFVFWNAPKGQTISVARRRKREILVFISILMGSLILIVILHWVMQ